MLKIGTFARPPFTAPVLPTPPGAFHVPPEISALVAQLAPVAARLQSIVPNPFGGINATIAQVKTQVQEVLQRALKAKVNAVTIPRLMPASMTANTSAITQFATDSKGVLSQATSAVDEFKKVIPTS